VLFQRNVNVLLWKESQSKLLGSNLSATFISVGFFTNENLTFFLVPRKLYISLFLLRCRHFFLFLHQSKTKPSSFTLFFFFTNITGYRCIKCKKLFLQFKTLLPLPTFPLTFLGVQLSERPSCLLSFFSKISRCCSEKSATQCLFILDYPHVKTFDKAIQWQQ